MGDAPSAPRRDPRHPVAIRLVVAPLLLALVVGVLWLQQATGSMVATDVLLLVLGAGGGLELGRLLVRRAPDLGLVQAVATCALLGGVGLLADDAGARMGWRVAIVFGAFLVLLVRHARDVRPEAVGSIALAAVPTLYVGLPMSFVHELAEGPRGALRCLFVVLVAKGSDIGGWVVGKPFGKHKLVPTVSPGKSWEGLAGGLVVSVAAALVLPGLLDLREAAWPAAERAGFGVLLGLASLLAGITQSGWKRRVGAKDSSTLIPEMGGVLDMIDSLLLAAPAAYLVYALVA